MLDPQLEHLEAVLRLRRIWALNVGENFQITLPAWGRFTAALPHTAVAYLYVSEHHLGGTSLKIAMRDAIRVNRKCAPPQHISSTSTSVLAPTMNDLLQQLCGSLRPQSRIQMSPWVSSWMHVQEGPCKGPGGDQ